MQLHFRLSAFQGLYCPIIEPDSSQLDIFELLNSYHTSISWIGYLSFWLLAGEVADGF